ncbi:MAG: lipoate--protein ligase family protein [Desulfuromonadia bacterium]
MNTLVTLWRLLVMQESDAPTVMAVDEAILSLFGDDQPMPTLRFYGWNPPALSLGRNQMPDQILDLEKCRREGVPLVRRITGGGIIYHADEITYSITCAPHHLPDTRGVKGSYRILTSFLQETYQGLGLSPRYAADLSEGGKILRSDFCFAGHEPFDILIGGKKLGGNAQRRVRGKIFQHGSIPLENRSSVGTTFLRHPPRGIDGSTTSLRELGVTLSRTDLIDLLADSFRRCLGVGLIPSPLTRAEQRRAMELAETKYRCEEWNLSGRLPP